MKPADILRAIVFPLTDASVFVPQRRLFQTMILPRICAEFERQTRP